MQWKADAHMYTAYIFSSSPHMIFFEFSKKSEIKRIWSDDLLWE